MMSKVENKIPVKVVYRHPEWEAFRNSVLKYADNRGEIYCQIQHPDLENIPHHWTNERTELIAEASTFKGGRVLDIGTHWGTTSATLAARGFKCIAIEHHAYHFEKTRMVAKLPGAEFEAINGDALAYDTGDRFDTLVMLNIAHHFQMKEDLYNRFVAFLKRNKFKEIFYQAHKYGDKWSTSSAMNLDPDKYLGVIMEATGMEYAEVMEDYSGRQLYHIF